MDWLIILLVLVEIAHVCVTIFLFFAVGGLGMQHKSLKEALLSVVTQVNTNLGITGENMKRLAQYVFDATGEDQPEEITLKPVDTKFKN